MTDVERVAIVEGTNELSEVLEGLLFRQPPFLANMVEQFSLVDKFQYEVAVKGDQNDVMVD